MSSASSPSLKRKAEQSPASSEGTEKKPKIDDNVSFRNNPVVSLEAAFNGQFQEKTGSMELKEDTVENVERFIYWLYKGDIKITRIGDPNYFHCRYIQLSQLYFFADKCGVIPLKNHIMTMLFDTIKDPEGRYRRPEKGCSMVISMSLVEEIYDNTVESSHLRKFVAATKIWPFNLTHLQRKSQWVEYNTRSEFVMDVGVALAQRASNLADPFTNIKSFLEPFHDKEVAEG
ncbi:MAG: hypothetical protein Q9226_000773 [Calogaya cf. arnoldii]